MPVNVSLTDLVNKFLLLATHSIFTITSISLLNYVGSAINLNGTEGFIETVISCYQNGY